MQPKKPVKKVDPFVAGMIKMLGKTGGPNGTRALSAKTVQSLTRKLGK